MAEKARTVKIRVPSSIKKGEEFQVRALVVHPMEIISRDKAGKMIEKNYNFVHTVSAAFNGTGFVVMNSTLNSGNSLRWMASAFPTSPCS